MDSVVQTHCSVYANMLTHCYLGVNELSSLVLNSVGLKMGINSQGGNCVPSSSIFLVFRFLLFFLYFRFSLIHMRIVQTTAFLATKSRLMS